MVCLGYFYDIKVLLKAEGTGECLTVSCKDTKCGVKVKSEDIVGALLL